MNDVTKLNLVPKGAVLDKLKADIDKLRAMFPLIAEAKKAAFDSYIKVGFTEAQAIELVKSLF
jgi:hypothetical protein